jgi:RNA polymerase sigma factor (sigma-70 family)
MTSAPLAVPARAARVSDADAASFEHVRPRLFAIAYRVLGSANEAEDVVQDAWLRWHRADRSAVRDAPAFLAATTTRLAINVAQSARARHEARVGPRLPDLPDAGADPAAEAERRAALEVALQSLLERLSPTERAAYLLREAFAYPYRDIAQLLTLSEPNARQLVTRARRRLGGEAVRPVTTKECDRLLDAFLAAARGGDMATLEHVLAPDARARLTRLPVRRGEPLSIAA